MKKVVGYVFLLVLIVLGGIFYAGYYPDIPLEKMKEKYTNETSQFVEIEGLSVHYRIEGEGPYLLLLHGTASSLHTWQAWVDALKDDFRIIRLDLPAFGLTGPNAAGDYTTEYYSDFLDNFLEAMEVKSCYMAGNSLGGSIAWNYALDHPDKVEKLILIDSGGYPRKKKSPFAFRLARNSWSAWFLKSYSPRFMFANNLKQVYGDEEKINDVLIDRYHDMMLREGNRQAFIDRAKTIYSDRSSAIKEITCPTLIQWGAEDTWIPRENGEKFKQAIAGSELIVYEGAGHVPMEEIPLKTAADALTFLKKP